MRKDSLSVLGIDVSGDIPAGELFRMTRDELMEPRTAYRITALRELCEEFCDTKLEPKKQIADAIDAAATLAPVMRFLDHEECWVLLLDRGNQAVSRTRMTVGDANSCIFDIKRIAKAAIIAGASGVIAFHNHLSGKVTPSKEDILETKELRQALDCISVKLVDHIIMADDRFYSFSDGREKAFDDLPNH